MALQLAAGPFINRQNFADCVNIFTIRYELKFIVFLSGLVGLIFNYLVLF
jgi:hypothetical protein